MPVTANPESWLAAIVDSSEYAVIGATPEGIVTTWSAGAARLYGYTAEEMVGGSLEKLLPDDATGSEIAAVLARIAEGAPVERVRASRRHKSGRLVEVVLSATPIRSPTGTLVGVASVTRDVSAETALLRELDATHARLRTLLEQTPVVVFEAAVTDGFAVTYISENVERVLGYPPAAFMDDGLFWQHAMHPDDLEVTLTGIRRVIAEGSGTLEHRFRRPDGTYVWLGSETTCLRDADARPARLVGYAFDIDQRKRLELESARHATELQRAVDERTSELRQRKTFLRSILNGIDDLVIVLDSDARIVEVSDSACRAYARPRDQLIGTALFDLSVPDTLAQLEAFWRAFVHAPADATSAEWSFPRPDGSMATLDVHTRRNFAEGLHLVVARDVTERTKAAAALRDSEERFEAFMDALPGTAWVKDAAGTFVYVNRRYLEILGRPREEWVGKRDRDLLPPDVFEKSRASDLEVMSRNAPQRGVESSGALTATRRHWEFAKFPFRNGKGESFLGGVAFDVTARVETQAEITRHRRRAEIAASLSKVLGHHAGSVRDAIDAAARHLGHQMADTCLIRLVARSGETLGAEGAYDRDPAAQELARTILSASRQDAGEGLTGRVMRTLETLRMPTVRPEDLRALTPEKYHALTDRLGPRSLLLVPLTHGGRALGALTLLRRTPDAPFTDEDQRIAEDAAERIAMVLENARLFEEVEANVALLDARVAERTASLEAARAAAETASRAKSVFLTNMSHEIRTPLNAVLGFSQLLLRESALSPRQVEFLGIINHAGDHLLALINDILELARIEAGRIAVEQESFHLPRLLDEIAAMFRMRAEAKGVEFRVEVARDLPRRARTDVRKLRQILVNLLGNAVKFTATGSVTLRVGHARSPTGGDELLVVDVMDTGVGIAAEDVPRLFAAFEQTVTGARAGGTGLGLAISRQQARVLGGDIEIESTLGAGSRFRLRLPVASSDEGSDRTLDTRRVIGIRKPHDEVRVLIVDDRDENRVLLRETLRAVGFSTRDAEDGQQAIAVFEAWAPHAIFMDMRMPGMSGFEATRRIKATERGKRTPIIALSASALDMNRAEALATGADDFLAKPLREAELFDTLARLLHVELERAERPVARPTPPRGSAPPRPLLAGVPAEVRARLRDAAVRASFDEIEEIARVLGGETPEAAALRDRLDRYEYEAIAGLVDEADALGGRGGAG